MSAGAEPHAGVACLACGEALVDGARFCEACGTPAGAGPPPGTAPATGEGGPPVAAGSAVPPPACEACGGQIDADGYCTTCGRRAPEPVIVDERGGLASATHRGRRYARNEDAVALATTAEGWPVLVVSDGVSASPNPHRASAAAVTAAAERLAERPFGGVGDLREAVAAAHEAASAVPADGDPAWTADGSHPACTLAIAVAAGDAVHTANVGDARVHVLVPDGDAWAAEQVSTDDSVAAHAVARGVDAATALSLPGGHGITAWLGADAPEPDPHLATHPTHPAGPTGPAGPGALVLACSDGLWNYAPTEAALAALATDALPPPGAPGAGLGAGCERLVAWANDQGGADNITVALARVPEPQEENP